MKNQIKRGKLYYLVLHKGDYSHKPSVIVPVKIIDHHRQGTYCDPDFYVVEVEEAISHYKYRVTINRDFLAPFDIEKAKNLAHNMQMWENRWYANNWRHNLTCKTAQSEIPKAIAEFPEDVQKREFWDKIKKKHPEVIRGNNIFVASRMIKKFWDDLAWHIIELRYPLKNVW